MPFMTHAAGRIRALVITSIAALSSAYGSAAAAPLAGGTGISRDSMPAMVLAQNAVVRPPDTAVPAPRLYDAPGIGASPGQQLPEVVRPPSVARRPADQPTIDVPLVTDGQVMPGGPRPPAAGDPPAGRPHQCAAGPPGAICN